MNILELLEQIGSKEYGVLFSSKSSGCFAKFECDKIRVESIGDMHLIKILHTNNNSECPVYTKVVDNIPKLYCKQYCDVVERYYYYFNVGDLNIKISSLIDAKVYPKGYNK